MARVAHEHVFTELGYFAERDCKAFKNALEGSTFMNFHISWSNWAGNCTLIVRTDYEETTEDDMKNFFLFAALNKLSDLQREAEK